MFPILYIELYFRALKCLLVITCNFPTQKCHIQISVSISIYQLLPLRCPKPLLSSSYLKKVPSFFRKSSLSQIRSPNLTGSERSPTCHSATMTSFRRKKKVAVAKRKSHERKQWGRKGPINAWGRKHNGEKTFSGRECLMVTAIFWLMSLFSC